MATFPSAATSWLVRPSGTGTDFVTSIILRRSERATTEALRSQRRPVSSRPPSPCLLTLTGSAAKVRAKRKPGALAPVLGVPLLGPELVLESQLPKGRPRAPVLQALADASVGVSTEEQPLPTLTSFLLDAEEGDGAADLVLVFVQLQTAAKVLASLTARVGLVHYLDSAVAASSDSPSTTNRDSPKALDIVANEVVKGLLRSSRRVAVMASEEDDLPTADFSARLGRFAVVFDPLDGSRNIEASIPTGTIFGIYDVGPVTDAQAAMSAALLPGSCLVAAGYVLYSSATMMVVSTGAGKGVHGFTLDPAAGEFLLSHPDMRMPSRGQTYSVNDARYFDWPTGLQKYIDDVRRGKGQSSKKYSQRYVCSLVADFHRTLLHGGIAMNPRSHLRLVYEANPLSFIAENAGGMGSDGTRRILDIAPSTLHQRLPLFLGSREDILELESYGNVQQLVNPGYEW